MKRIHRRLHLLVWLIAGPLTAAGLALALNSIPADPLSEIPAAAVTDGRR